MSDVERERKPLWVPFVGAKGVPFLLDLEQALTKIVVCLANSESSMELKAELYASLTSSLIEAHPCNKPYKLEYVDGDISVTSVDAESNDDNDWD